MATTDLCTWCCCCKSTPYLHCTLKYYTHCILLLHKWQKAVFSIVNVQVQVIAQLSSKYAKLMLTSSLQLSPGLSPQLENWQTLSAQNSWIGWLYLVISHALKLHGKFTSTTMHVAYTDSCLIPTFLPRHF